jgi:hypothetical protein
MHFHQGSTFCQDTKVPQLPMYDIILGADYLEDNGPMWIDWKQKIMKFKLAGKKITLCGVKDDTSSCHVVSERGLKDLLNRSAITHLVELSVCAALVDTQELLTVSTEVHIPLPVQELLQTYKDLFAPPRSLPPQRAIDHQLPLVSGAQPVSVRSYWYSSQ